MEINAHLFRGTIFDAVRSINDVEYSKLQNIPGLITTFDHFKKAFDSLSWGYLLNTLTAFNFDDSCLDWIGVLIQLNLLGLFNLHYE